MFTHLRKHQAIPVSTEQPQGSKWDLLRQQVLKEGAPRTGWNYIAQTLRTTPVEALLREMENDSPDKDDAPEFKRLSRAVSESWRRVFRSHESTSTVASSRPDSMASPVVIEDSLGIEAFKEVCDDLRALIEWASKSGDVGLEHSVYLTQKRHTGSSFQPVIKAIRGLPFAPAEFLQKAVPGLSRALGRYNDKDTQPFQGQQRRASEQVPPGHQTPVLRFDDLQNYVMSLAPESQLQPPPSGTDSPKTSPKKDPFLGARKDAVVAWCRLLVARVEETQRAIEDQIRQLTDVSVKGVTKDLLVDSDSRALFERVAALINDTDVPEPLRRQAFDAVALALKSMASNWDLTAISGEFSKQRDNSQPVDEDVFLALNFALTQVYKQREWGGDSTDFETEYLNGLWAQIISLSNYPKLAPDFHAIVSGCHHYGLLKRVCDEVKMGPLTTLIQDVVDVMVPAQEASKLFRGSTAHIYLTVRYLDRASGNRFSQLATAIRDEVILKVKEHQAAKKPLGDIHALQAIAESVYAAQLIKFDWGGKAPEELIAIMQRIENLIRENPGLSPEKVAKLYSNPIIAGQDTLIIFRGIATMTLGGNYDDGLDEDLSVAVRQTLSFIMAAMTQHSLMRPNSHAFDRHPVMDTFLDAATGTTDRLNWMKTHFSACEDCEGRIRSSVGTDSVETEYFSIYSQMNIDTLKGLSSDKKVRHRTDSQEALAQELETVLSKKQLSTR